MGSETWTQDSTDYGVVSIPTTYFNQTKDNINVLHKGNGQTSLTTISADVSRQLDVGSTDQTFFVNGSYNVAYISTANREPGNTIHLIKSGGLTNIAYNQGSVPAGYGEIFGNGAGASTVTWNDERLVTLVYDGTAWHHDMKFT